MAESIGIAVITHNAKHHLKHCLPPLLSSPLRPRVVVANSSSEDGTVEEAKRLGAETWVVPRSAFNHGTTREQVRQHLGTDIVVMMTPDAYATDESVLERLVAPIRTLRVSLTYGRQIPREGATTLESFLRHFNYPAESHVRGIEDAAHWGAYTFFCSNSWAAYRNSALDEVGGFPSVLMAEDCLATAALLRNGHKIAYVADATVRHSHHYTLKQELRRHFDVGFVRKQHAKLIDAGATDSQRGRQYFIEMNKLLIKHKPSLLPYAWAHVAAKWLGYQLGRNGSKLPLKLVQRLTSQDYYWTSDDYTIRR